MSLDGIPILSAIMERDRRIELLASDWKSEVLPLYESRNLVGDPSFDLGLEQSSTAKEFINLSRVPTPSPKIWCPQPESN